VLLSIKSRGGVGAFALSTIISSACSCDFPSTQQALTSVQANHYREIPSSARLILAADVSSWFTRIFSTRNTNWRKKHITWFARNVCRIVSRMSIFVFPSSIIL
jgi:hypothetical protein